MSSYEAIFDLGGDRRGTQSDKWDGLKRMTQREDALPMWVADMDIPSPAEVTEALVRRAQHPMYGYTREGDADYQAVIDWQMRRNGLAIERDWILWSPGVVDSLSACIYALTEPGDQVLVLTPIYGPFIHAPQEAGRQLVTCPLILDDAGYRMDYEGIARAFEGGVKLLLLCSPHNPVGRVWTADELSRLLKLSDAHGVTVVSDEIHSDFILEGHKHHPILEFEGAENRVMLISATKTFNLAGLKHSSLIAPGEAIRKKIQDTMRRYGFHGGGNIFGMTAQRAAYEQGDAWLDALLAYLKGNRDLVMEELKTIPHVRAAELQGTYLMWLNVSDLHMTSQALVDYFADELGLALCAGWFGEEDGSYIRMNIACPRATVREAMARFRAGMHRWDEEHA